MNTQHLHSYMDEYALWKRSLIREIMRYHSWLAQNKLDTPELLQQLQNSLKSLRADHITLAFIGEFSRGKTELINSLFFADYGQRLLPSDAGRTTMCPTEIFFDAQQATSSMQLLPIETRHQETSLTQLKSQANAWTQIAIDHGDSASLASALSHLTQTKSVAIETAIALGFSPDAVENAEQADHVLIPAWRHALVNIDHPLLRQGLRIIDTPGLNALGSEPELTFSLLPSAQAVLFLLSADTGVTASDMAIWQEHIQTRQESQPTLQFAVLNKIDTLWDSLNQDTFAEHSIQNMQVQTAKLLGLTPEQVLPVSAKSALQGKINKDAELLSHSRIHALEAFICKHVIAQKEQLLEHSVVRRLCGLLNTSQRITQQRLALAQAEQHTLNQQPHNDSTVLLNLLEQAKTEHQGYHRKLLNLKSNQRLLHRQGAILCDFMQPQKLQQQIAQAETDFAQSWTTLGIQRAIAHFFTALDNNLFEFENEAQMANKMVRAIYLRYNTDNSILSAEAPTLRISRYRRELQQLRSKSDAFGRNFKSLLTEQSVLSRRFFTTLAQEAFLLHERIHYDALHWSNDALTPLIQQNLEQKQLLENHLLRLKSLAQTAHSSQQRNQLLSTFINALSAQQMQVQDILRNISRPAPQRRQAKVVQLATPLMAQRQE